MQLNIYNDVKSFKICPEQQQQWNILIDRLSQYISTVKCSVDRQSQYISTVKPTLCTYYSVY
jgi:hypothetical protein